MDRRILFVAVFAAALVVSAFPGFVAVGWTATGTMPAGTSPFDTSLMSFAVEGVPPSATARDSKALAAALATSAAEEKFTYIIIMQAPPLASYRGGMAGLAPTDRTVTGTLKLDVDSDASRAYLGRISQEQTQLLRGIESALSRQLDVRFRYQAALNGFAVQLTPSEAEWVESLPWVLLVQRDEVRYLLTDNGPRWIGASSIWGEDPISGACDTLRRTCGEGVVVGVIDTGVNADHPSFADPGPVDGYNYPPPVGGYKGLCNPVTGAPFCNDKLIGVYDFTPNPPFTGEDINGHGSHTASTAAGNVVDAALVAPTITLTRRISGVAPHANVINYRACQTLIPQVGCLLSGLLAAINQATLDGVDVINYSIGGGSADPWTDADAQAFLNARRAGIFIAASAGNSGPGPRTIGSPSDAPWVLSVGASTHDRKLENVLLDMFGGGSPPPADISGKSLTKGYPLAPLRARIVYAGDPPYNNALCGSGPADPATGRGTSNPFPPGTFNGQIVVCDRGTYGRVHKGENLRDGGAGGYILANDAASGGSLIGDPHVLPAVHITFADGVTLKAWIASGSGPSGLPSGRIRGTIADVNPANGDVMASFSSRGPNPSVPDIIRPDVTAPGVDILAAFADPIPPGQNIPYGVISGTSMSSPHAAGAAALIRALNPTWSPDEVKSALMTTSFRTLPGSGSEVHGVFKEDGVTPADAFDMGAGRIDLRQAHRAGLILDENPANYGGLNAPPADVKALNLPSMADDNCAGTCSWTRVLEATTVTSIPVTWTVQTSTATGLALSVSPSSFSLAPGATRAVTVTADVNAATPGQWHFGQVILVPSLSNIPQAHLPVAVFAAGGVTPNQLALHFHGNGFGDHDAGHADEDLCTGDGKADIFACSGPFLLKSGVLSPSPAASWKDVAANWAVDGGSDRTVHDANWIWCLRTDTGTEFQCPVTEVPAQGTVTVSGPMTIKWWAQCGALCALGTDWDIEVWVDGVRIVQQRVEAGAAGTTSLLTATVSLPRTTANHRIVVEIEPVFLVDQALEFAIFYDSTRSCPGATVGPCDSIVLMPIESPNRAPIAVDDGASIQKGGITTIAVLANDNDPDGDPITVTSVGTPSNGTATKNPDNTITYTHNGDGAIADSFTYTIGDGRGGSDTATVTIAINQPPNAVDDSANVQRGRSVTVPVLDNDSDANGDALSVSSVGPASNGVTSTDGTRVTYTHNGGPSTSDSFSYTASDGRGGSDTATVRITVTNLPDLVITELEAVNNRPDDADDDFDNDGRLDDVDDDDDNDGVRDNDDDDDDNDNRRDGRTRQSDKVTITATVANTGTSRVSVTTKTEFRLTGPDGTRVLALVDTGPIPAGGTRKVSIVWDTRGEKPGSHIIKATADRTNKVVEADENNNSREILYFVVQNQAPNGSFEEDTDANGQPDGWSGQSTGAGTTSYSDGGSHGQKSASMAGNGGNAAVYGSPTWTSAAIAVTPGTLMDLQVKLRANGVSSPANVRLVYLGPVGNVLGTVTVLTTPLTTAAFILLEKAVTIPVGVAYVQIVLVAFALTDVATAGTVAFDDIGLFVR